MSNRKTPINLQILTPSGFQSFDSIKRWWHDTYIQLNFIDGTNISCAKNHRFIINNKEKYAHEIEIGDNIGKIVSDISIINKGKYFYDPINVQNGEIYCHDDVFVSHNSFVATGDTLISTEALLRLNSIDPIENKNNFKIYEKPKNEHQYVMSVDVGKGCGMDYSAFSIIDITNVPYKQVAIYKDNTISPLLLATILHKYALYYNQALVIVENNDQGIVVCNDLYYDIEYENTFVSSTLRSDGIGITTNKKTKKIGCSMLKDFVETGNLEIWNEDTINELMCFTAKNEIGTTFEASKGNHDDLVMTLVIFSYFTTLIQFQEYQEISLKNALHQKKIEDFDDHVLPFFVDDGREEEFIKDNNNQVWQVVDF